MSNRFNPKKRQFNKSNYVEIIEKLIPSTYFIEDLALSGTHADPVEQIIQSHINSIINIASVISISATDGIYSALDTPSGISPYFVKQNGLTNITPEKFENLILGPLNKSFGDFDTSAEFVTYLETELIPAIKLNEPSATFPGYSTDASTTHEHLVSSLSWFYFLNTSADGGLAYEPSTTVVNSFATKLYRGQDLLLVDGIKAYSDYIFNNYETCTTWQNYDLIPADLKPHSLVTTSSIYTSGTQQLDKIKTLVEVVYSPLYFDQQDFRVQEAINNYFTLADPMLDRLESAGPFFRLIKAFSFGFADVMDDVTKLGILYDIEDCPAELLPELANLIGWNLYGSDPERWRLQLINAVDIYKKAGTKKSIQFAVDAVFTDDVFDVSSKISELWESYIPNLMLYALATEAPVYKDFSTWTLKESTKMGVFGYSTSSMEENMRMVVDTILVKLQEEFPQLFILGNKEFPVGDPNFVFSYRGRTMPIPPFDDPSYYMGCDLSEPIILSLIDKLVCFGVNQEFAIKVGEYIRTNTIESSDDIREGNRWLIFTSGVNYPPNLDEVMLSISTKRSDYLSLWNGKSSHYRILLDASSFDFSKNTLEVDSKAAIQVIAKAAREFSPAHAIDMITLSVSEAPDEHEVSATLFEYLGLDKPEYNLLTDSSRVNRQVSGADMGGWHRDTSTGTAFFRRDVDSHNDLLINTTDAISVPRNSFRRRNYNFLLPKEGLYTRTGFNAPISWDPSTIENSHVSSLGFLPLGYNPAIGEFVSAGDISSITPVYDRCNTLDSSNSFYGIDVSNTFPYRGLSAMGSNAKGVSATDRYVDRGQLHPVIAVMHDLSEQKSFLSAQEIVEATPSAYQNDANWWNATQSVANSGIESSGWFPTDIQDYKGFEFGRGIAQLFKDYTTIFYQHHTRPDILELEGPTIFAHAFGSIFRNSDFSKVGQIGASYPEFIASATSDASALYNGALVFDPTLSATYNSTTHNSLTDIVVPVNDNTGEVRNSQILSGVELIQTSATSPINSFTLYNVDKASERANQPNFIIENPLVKLKAVDGFPRIRYNLKTYENLISEGFARTDNLLVPNHDISLTVKVAGGNEEGTETGGTTLGVWIHTENENGMIWNLDLDGNWVLMEEDDLTKEEVLTKYTHTHLLPIKKRSEEKEKFQCIDYQGEHNVIGSFTEEDFSEFVVEFDTKNKGIVVPEQYYKTQGQVHRQDQNYYVEIFMLPQSSKSDRFLLLDYINLLDVTQNLRTKPAVYGDTANAPFKTFCNPVRAELKDWQVLDILRYFNEISGNPQASKGLASRDSSLTEDRLEASGGGRLNYRISPKWGLYTQIAGVLTYNIIEIDDSP